MDLGSSVSSGETFTGTKRTTSSEIVQGALEDRVLKTLTLGGIAACVLLLCREELSI